MQTEPIKVVSLENQPEHRVDFITKRTYEDLCDHLKSEAKEKAYEPPFPYETQEPVPGTWGAVKREDHPVTITANLVETDSTLSSEPILQYIERSLKMDAVVSALRVIDQGVDRIRYAVGRVGVKRVVLMGVPVEIDPMMEPGTWKLVVSKLPTQMRDITR